MGIEMDHVLRTSQAEPRRNIHLPHGLLLTSSSATGSLCGGSISLGHDPPELSALLSSKSYHESQSPKMCFGLLWGSSIWSLSTILSSYYTLGSIEHQ